MDFTNKTFGELLFAINNDHLKNKVRKIERINKRIVQTESGIYFNEICLKEGLQPKFSNIYIYIYISIPCSTQSWRINNNFSADILF